MDRFVVRKAAQSTNGAPAAKRPCVEGGSTHPEGKGPSVAADGCESARGDPQRLISWNVNGLVPQLKNEWSRIRAFIEREQPDVLCLQEVRLPAAGPKGCKRGDGQKRRRREAKKDTQQERDDWQLVERTLLATFGPAYTAYWSLADWKYSGTLMLVRKPLQPTRVTYTLPELAAPGGHQAHRDVSDPGWHPEGRIIFACFETFDVFATYAPNNGSDQPAFERRAAWDSALLKELSARTRPLVWIGDLNCAATEADVSHPAWFLQQCYQGDPPDMRGQPGFTPGERRRFQEILKSARLVDAHRTLHPASEPPPADGPHYTWRGHPPVHQPVAKYHGKGMRIDYGLIAEELVCRLEGADILGSDASRVGFMGSDHCPVRLVLRPAGAEVGSPPAGVPANTPAGEDAGNAPSGGQSPEKRVGTVDD